MLHINVTTAKAKDEMRQNRPGGGRGGAGNAAAFFPFEIVLFVIVFFFIPMSQDLTHLEANVASWVSPGGREVE